MGHFFKLSFGNATGPGRVNEILKMLFVNGKWRPIFAKGPENEQVQVFLNPDKNGRQVKTEGATKRLGDYFRELLGDHKVSARREEGIISVDGAKLAMVVIGDDNASVKFIQKTLDKHGLDKKQAQESFESRENDQWCS